MASIIERAEDAAVRVLSRRRFIKGTAASFAVVAAGIAGAKDVMACYSTPVCCCLAHPYCYDYGVYSCDCKAQSSPNYGWGCTWNTYVYVCYECDHCPCSYYTFVGRSPVGIPMRPTTLGSGTASSTPMDH